MAQYGLPSSDGDHVNWTQGAGDGDASHFDELDEGFGAGRGSGSGPDDVTTYWKVASATTSNAIIFSNIPALTDPVSSSGHIIRSRERKSATGGKQLDVRVGVSGGGGLGDAGATTTNFDTTTWTTHSYTFTGAEADSITDYGALIPYTQAIFVGGGAGRECHVSAQEFECPGAAAGKARIPTAVNRPQLYPRRRVV